MKSKNKQTQDQKKLFLVILPILWIGLPIIFATLQINTSLITDKLAKIDAFLVNFLWVSVGIQATLAGLMQIFSKKKNFQYSALTYNLPANIELAYANLSFGILGLLCIYIKGTWWPATAIGYSIFLLCIAWGHAYEMVVNRNYSLREIIPAVWFDILISFILLMLIAWHYGMTMQRMFQ